MDQGQDSKHIRSFRGRSAIESRGEPATGSPQAAQEPDERRASRLRRPSCGYGKTCNCVGAEASCPLALDESGSETNRAERRRSDGRECRPVSSKQCISFLRSLVRRGTVYLALSSEIVEWHRLSQSRLHQSAFVGERVFQSCGGLFSIGTGQEVSDPGPRLETYLSRPVRNRVTGGTCVTLTVRETLCWGGSLSFMLPVCRSDGRECRPVSSKQCISFLRSLVRRGTVYLALSSGRNEVVCPVS